MTQRGLPRLKLRFPAARDVLTAHYLSDALFRSLCAAYEDAYEALERCEREAAVRQRELADYRQLVLDIETDIQALIPRLAEEQARHRPRGFMTLISARFQALVRKR